MSLAKLTATTPAIAAVSATAALARDAVRVAGSSTVTARFHMGRPVDYVVRGPIFATPRDIRTETDVTGWIG